MYTQRGNHLHTEEAHLERSQTSKIEPFAEMICGFQPFTIKNKKKSVENKAMLKIVANVK